MRPSTSRGLLWAGVLAGLFTSTASTPVRNPVQALFVLEDSSAGDAQLNRDFPDPSIIRAHDGFWYSYATNSNGKNVQVARAHEPLGPWEWLDFDVMPDRGWTSGRNTWAPDVRRTSNGSYVLYFSGELPNQNGKHCVGVALAMEPLGPYTPQPEPWACHLDQGGAIDPAGFLDTSTGRRYVTYKVDGNHDGNGGDCGNSIEPLAATPLMLQEVDAVDGHTKIGPPVQILDRTAADGPLVEAPSIALLSDGTYVLFYSSFCFSSSRYNVNYATARTPEGPYERAARPLLVTGDFGLQSPGGASSVMGGGQLLFHANCEQGRCLYTTNYLVVGSEVIVGW
ncbi:glycosyl hydrolase family 43 protein [Plectosphaerella cucumerina]|uniref:Glycosyl hydrolase family 43 protein n=1 Tax=Plectosphaerella cucumerina TaxID=40658 RepID=A0A8K0X4F2_9PEZI|nr:glycosyl hydrolase family 43 protein [Plectosphaerella cucumerina]